MKPESFLQNESLVLARTHNRINRGEKIAGKKILGQTDRLHHLYKLRSLSLNHLIRDNSIIHQQLLQLGLNKTHFDSDFVYPVFDPIEANNKIPKKIQKDDELSKTPSKRFGKKSSIQVTKRKMPIVKNPFERQGRPIDGMLRYKLEPLLQFNLSQVRIHTNLEHTEQVKKNNADAITIGNHIYFGPAKYNPVSRKGKALLVHELTHVRQQKQMKNLKNHISVNKMQHFEQEALTNEHAIMHQQTELPVMEIKPEYQSSQFPALNSSEFTFRKNENQSNHVPMAASVNRNIDSVVQRNFDETSELLQNDEQQHAELDDIYHSLKLKLQIEKERMGD